MATTQRTFGVELEVSGISVRNAYRAVSGAGLPARSTYYSDHAARGATWLVKPDGSVDAEVVSPPLTETETVRPYMSALYEAGARVDRRCGMHVHVYVGDLDLDALKRLACLYLKAERALNGILAPSRRNGYYCRNNVQGSLADQVVSVRRARDFRSVAAIVDRQERYHKLNCRPYWRQGTVEFRAHQGTLNFAKFEHWTLLAVGLVDYAKAGGDIPAGELTLDQVLDLVFAGGGTPARTPRARLGSAAAQLYPHFTAATTYPEACAIAERLGLTRNTAKGALFRFKRALAAAGTTDAEAESRKTFLKNRAAHFAA